MDTKSAGVLGACIIVAALVVTLVPQLTTGDRGALRSIHSADGRLAVTYTIQTSPTTSEGSSVARVTGIQFFPSYVVVTTQKGHGKVLFAERTQRLDWSLRPPPNPDDDGGRAGTAPAAKPAEPVAKP